jgi:long-chain acyl-CoA synthetase
VLALAAIFRLGAVAVPLNTKYTTPELDRQLRQSRACLLLAEPEFWPKAEPVSPTAVVLTSEFARIEGELIRPSIGPDDPATLLFTSGTTGFSKSVVHSHRNVVAAAETWIRCLDLGPDDRTVVAAPLFHVTGWHGQLFPILAAGGAGTILPRFDGAKLAALFSAGEATFFHAAPTIYSLMLSQSSGRSAERLRVSVAGGSFVSRGLVEKMQSFAPGVDFRISYGMTETTSPGALTPAGYTDNRPGDAVGVAVPVDDVAVDEQGEILFRGATVIASYEAEPEVNERSFAGGWLRSGDLGTIDDRGFVTVLDRIKDVINRGGEKISSLEVETVLAQHPGVRDAAVVAKPDPVYGEVPRAIVVADGVSSAELLEFARTRLAKYKVPVEVAFVEELPRNPGGKVLKQLLR